MINVFTFYILWYFEREIAFLCLTHQQYVRSSLNFLIDQQMKTDQLDT